MEKGKNSKMSNPTPSVTLDADADEDADADDVDDVNDDVNDAAPPTPEGAARGACGKVVSAPRSRKVRQGASSSVEEGQASKNRSSGSAERDPMEDAARGKRGRKQQKGRGREPVAASHCRRTYAFAHESSTKL